MNRGTWEKWGTVRLPVCVRTGMAWSSFFWLFIVMIGDSLFCRARGAARGLRAEREADGGMRGRVGHDTRHVGRTNLRVGLYDSNAVISLSQAVVLVAGAFSYVTNTFQRGALRRVGSLGSTAVNIAKEVNHPGQYRVET